MRTLREAMGQRLGMGAGIDQALAVDMPGTSAKKSGSPHQMMVLAGQREGSRVEEKHIP